MPILTADVSESSDTPRYAVSVISDDGSFISLISGTAQVHVPAAHVTASSLAHLDAIVAAGLPVAAVFVLVDSREDLRRCAALRERSGLAEAFFVVCLKEHQEDDLVSEALRAGCDDFICLPRDEARIGASLKIADRFARLRARFGASRDHLREEAAEYWCDDVSGDLEQVFDTSPNPICLLDADLVILRANVPFARFCAAPWDRIGGVSCESVVAEDLCGVLRGLMRQVLTSEDWAEEHCEIRGHDGALARWAVTARPLRSNAGHIRGLIATFADRSEQYRSVERFNKLNLLFETLLNNTHVILACLDTEGQLTLMNRGAEEILGYPREEAVGNPAFWEWLFPDPIQRAFYQAKVDYVVHEKRLVHDLESVMCTRTGEERVVLWDGQAMVAPTGEVEGVICLGRDVTEQRRVETEQSEWLQRVHRQQKAILDLATNQAVYEGILPEAFSVITEAAAVTLRAHKASIWLFSADASLLKCVDSFSVVTSGHSHGRTILQKCCPDFFQAVQIERVVDVADAVRDERTAEFVEDYAPGERSLSVLAAGIRHSGKLVGALLVENAPARRAWTADEVAIAGEFADMSAQALGNDERRRATDALSRSETLFRTIIEQSEEGITLVLPDGRFFLANPKFCEMTGYAVEDLRALTFQHLLPLDTHLNLPADLVSGMELKEIALVRRDGTTFLAEMGGYQLELESDRLIMAIVRNVTERVLFARALKREHDFIAAVLDTAGALVAVLDEEGRIVRFNKLFQQRSGYSIDEVQGMYLWDIFAVPEESERIHQQMQLLLDGRYNSKFESVWHAAGGVEMTVAWSNTVISDSRGRVEFLIAAGIDVTERHRAEAARHRLAQAIDQAGEAIFITDAEGLIQYVNPAFEQLTGYARDEAVGRTPRLLRSGKHRRAFYDRIWKTIRNGQLWRGRLIDRGKDGTLIEMESTISPVRDLTGQITNFVSVNRDMTNEVRLERQLRQAQKMEAIGTLAGGIAHDFNNILSVVLGYSELLRDEIPAASKAAGNLGQVIRAVERAKDLIAQILTFSRHVEAERTLVQVGVVVKESLKLMRATIPTTVEILSHIDAKAGSVLADATQLHQVIMNLCTNAYHAMEENGGLLRVAVSPFHADEGFAAHFPQVRPGDYVRLTIADTGRGMDEGTLERIFEPFFSTKELGKGTGLGLSVVHGIVTALDGAILVQSTPGGGTTFDVFLPRFDARPKPLPKPEEEIPCGKGQRVLLVDDEETVLQMSREVLERLGYTVDPFVASTEALEHFLVSADLYDLVVTDQTMPRLTGVNLAARILERKPGMPIILTTGYSESVDASRAKALGIRGYLQKPYNRKTLAKTVHDVLALGIPFVSNAEQPSPAAPSDPSSN